MFNFTHFHQIVYLEHLFHDFYKLIDCFYLRCTAHVMRGIKNKFTLHVICLFLWVMLLIDDNLFVNNCLLLGVD